MLSLTSEFTQKDIARIRTLKPKAVWLLAGNGTDVVIKYDTISVQHSNQSDFFNTSKKAMGAVDANVKSTKRLTINEMQALRQFVLRQKSFVQYTTGNQIPGATADLDSILSKYSDTDYIWYKMPYTPIISMENALEAKFGKEGTTEFQPNDGPLLKFQQALMAPNGLEAFGRVVAADMFSQNGDRIMPSNPDPNDRHRYSYAGYDFSLKTVQNIGNLMVSGHGSSKAVTGMDFADPFSPLKIADHTAPLADELGADWSGNIIVDKKRRATFAREIVEDLEQIFTAGRKKSFRDRLPGKRTVLGSDAVKRLEAGMVQGARQIAAAYQTKIGTKQYSQSFKDRIAEYQKVA